MVSLNYNLAPVTVCLCSLNSDVEKKNPQTTEELKINGAIKANDADSLNTHALVADYCLRSLFNLKYLPLL
jgi:hypothetical protein